MSEIRKIVKEINEKLFMSSMSEHDYMSYLELVESPIGDYIKYMGNFIWDSENDCREYLKDEDGEDTEELEDLADYLKSQIMLICKVAQDAVLSC